MHRIIAALALCGSAVLCGCGSSGNSSGPKSPANVTGSWTYTASDLSGDGYTCTVTGAILTLEQTDTTFAGTYADALLSCTSGSTTINNPGLSGDIVNGTVSGSSVSFEIDGATYTNTGSVSGTTMSGTASLSTAGSGTNITVTGSWTAAQQSTTATVPPTRRGPTISAALHAIRGS